MQRSRDRLHVCQRQLTTHGLQLSVRLSGGSRYVPTESICGASANAAGPMSGRGCVALSLVLGSLVVSGRAGQGQGHIHLEL